MPPIPGMEHCQTHTACQANEFVSVHNRIVGETVLPTPKGVAAVRHQLRKLAGKLQYPAAETMDQVMAHFKGARFTLYDQARKSLLAQPFCARDANISTFIKAEKFHPSAKVNPDPRPIQARGPRFNLHMARYIHPLEKVVYNLLDSHGLRVFAKGLNSFQRAALISAKFACLEKPVCFSLDASRWDKHVSLAMLKAEHAFYTHMFPGDDFLKHLCRLQQVNKCRTSNGVVYTATGGRMSGDMNTALGNCVLMYAMLMGVADKLGVEPLVVDDGDDCLMFVEEWHAGRFQQHISKLFREYGMDIKLENRATVPEQVVFCQSKIVAGRMVRNPLKVMSNGTSGVKHWNDPRLTRSMFTAVGSCELSCNAGVPVLQEYALALKRNGRGQRMTRMDIDHGVLLRALYEVGSEQAIYDSAAKEITMEARIEFEKVWGIPVGVQDWLERRLRDWDVEDIVAQPVGVEIRADWVVQEDPSRVFPVDPAFWTGD